MKRGENAAAPIDVVRAFYERAISGDEGSVTELLHPEVVWVGTKGGLDEKRVLRGPAEFLAYLREIAEPWEEWRVEIENTMEVTECSSSASRRRCGAPTSTFAMRRRGLQDQRGPDRRVKGYLDRAEEQRDAGPRPPAGDMRR